MNSQNQKELSFVESILDFTGSSINSNISGLLEESFYGFNENQLPQSDKNTVTEKSDESVSKSTGSCNVSVIKSAESSETVHSDRSVTSVSSQSSSQPEPFSAASQEKLQEYYTLLNLVNEAYVEYKTSEFLVKCAKESAIGAPVHVKNIVQNVLESSTSTKRVQLKSRTGECLTVFGSDIKPELNETVFSPEKLLEVNKRMTQVVLMKVEEIKQQKSIFHGLSGNGNITNNKLVEMRSNKEQELSKLPEGMQRAEELINDRKKLMSEEDQMAKHCTRLLKSYHELLCNKAVFISDKSRKLKLELENKNCRDPEVVTFFNRCGERMKSEVGDLKVNLEQLRTTLAQYESKCASSKTYKDIVETYGKIKRQLVNERMIVSIIDGGDNE